jgi:hypothetical protein
VPSSTHCYSDTSLTRTTPLTTPPACARSSSAAASSLSLLLLYHPVSVIFFFVFKPSRHSLPAARLSSPNLPPRAHARHVAHARSSHAFGACCRDGDNTCASTTTNPLIFSIHFCYLYYHLHLLLLLLRVVPLACLSTSSNASHGKQTRYHIRSLSAEHLGQQQEHSINICAAAY